MKIKALSVKQPWAGLIVSRIKDVENRPWRLKVPAGIIAICASRKPEPKWVFEMVKTKLNDLGIPYPTDICEINGACIGTVDHIGTIWMQYDKPFTDSPKRVVRTPDQLRTWWIEDQYGWVLNDQRIIEPIPVKGRLSIYEIDIPIQYKER